MRTLPLFFAFLLCIMLNSCFTSGEKIMPVFLDVNPDKIVGKEKLFPIKKDSGTRIVVPQIPKEKIIKPSDLLDSVSFIALSNQEEAMIGTINKLTITHNSLFILDRYKTKSVKRFAMTGDLIAQIGHPGPGPEEYAEPTDFCVTENQVLVYDQFRQRILFYDLNGKFMQAKRVPFAFMEFHRFSPNSYLFRTLDSPNNHLPSLLDYPVFETDSNFVVQNKGFYRKKDLYRRLLNESDFSPMQDKVYYRAPYGDTIFSILPGGLEVKPSYIFDYGKRTLPENLLIRENNKKFTQEENESRYVFPSKYVILDDYVFFTYSVAHLLYYGIYSKQTESLVQGNRLSVDKISGLFLMNNIVSSYQNALVGYMEPSDIVKSLKTASRDRIVEVIGEKHTQIAEKMNTEDNPYLVFFHLKKF